MIILRKNFAVTVLLWIFSRKMCGHCVVMIILKKNCAVTVLL